MRGWERRMAVPVIALLSMALVAMAVDLGLRVSGLGSLLPFPSTGGLDYSAGPPGGFAPLDARFVNRFLGRADGGLATSPDLRARGSAGVQVGRVTEAGLAGPVLITHEFTNDRFANAYPVPSIPFRAETDSKRATSETGEPASCASPLGGKTAWYAFTAPRQLSLLADTLGTSYATALTVYQGSSLSSLRPVAPCNGDPRGNAMVAFTAQAGTAYFFQIDGSIGGHLVFSLQERGVTTRASVGPGGLQSDGDSLLASVSDDGTRLLFASGASSLDGAARRTPCAPSGVVPCGKMATYLRDRTRHHTVNVDPGQSVTPARSDVGSLVAPGSVSADGRYSVFFATAEVGVPAPDPNRPSPYRRYEVYRRDNLTGVVELVSKPCAGCGAVGDGASGRGEMSADGRYVAFVSWASNLVPGDTNLVRDVFVRDMLKGITIRVSVPDRSMPERQANGVPSNTGNQGADVYSISRDGKRVVFNASASNLVANDNNRATDVFVRDIPSGTTERVSLSSSGAEANGDSRSVMGFGLHTVSDDGRYVVFNSDATNLVNRTTDGKENVYRRDRWLGTTTLMTVSSTDAAANNSVGPGDYRQTIYTEVAPIIMAGGLTVGLSPLSYSMTADGRYVVFNSDATNLVPGDTNTATDIFLHDAANGSTARVSVSSDGAQAEGGSCDSPTISADGSFVAFHSTATNLVINDTNQSADVFVREMPRPNPMTGWY